MVKIIEFLISVMKPGVTFPLFFVLIKQTPHHFKHHLKCPFSLSELPAGKLWVRAGPCWGAQYGEGGVEWKNIVQPLGLVLFQHSCKIPSNRNTDFFFFLNLTLSEMPVKWSRSRKILDSEMNRNLTLATTFEGEVIIWGKADQRVWKKQATSALPPHILSLSAYKKILYMILHINLPLHPYMVLIAKYMSTYLQVYSHLSLQSSGCPEQNS